MPNINIYFNKETLKIVQAEAGAEKIQISTISETQKAQKHLFKTLVKKQPFGELEEFILKFLSLLDIELKRINGFTKNI